MRVLCSGSAGFIGSNVADALIGAGHTVAVLDNLSTGFKENVNPLAKFYQCDIRCGQAVTMAFTDFRPDAVIHHAAQMDVRRSTREPIFDAQVNIIGSLNLILAASHFGVKRFLYASTGGAVYGDVPAKDLPVSEDYPVNPVCQYGISKHTVEHYLFLYHKLYGLPYTVLRYPNVFGIRQRPGGEAGVVAIFAGQLLDGEQCTIFGDGSKSRDYVYIDDVVRANLLALGAGYSGILNIGSGIGTSDQEVYDIVAAAVGSDAQPKSEAVRPGEVQNICLNGAKALQVLGWKPEISFAVGVARTVNYIQKQRGANATV